MRNSPARQPSLSSVRSSSTSPSPRASDEPLSDKRLSILQENRTSSASFRRSRLSVSGSRLSVLSGVSILAKEKTVPKLDSRIDTLHLEVLEAEYALEDSKKKLLLAAAEHGQLVNRFGKQWPKRQRSLITIEEIGEQCEQCRAAIANAVADRDDANSEAAAVATKLKHVQDIHSYLLFAKRPVHATFAPHTSEQRPGLPNDSSIMPLAVLPLEVCHMASYDQFEIEAAIRQACEEAIAADEERASFERRRAEVDSRLKSLRDTCPTLTEKLNHLNVKLANVSNEIDRLRVQRQSQLRLVEKALHERDDLARRENSAHAQLTDKRVERDAMRSYVWKEIERARGEYVGTEVAKKRIAVEQKSHLEDLLGCARTHTELITSGKDLSYLRWSDGIWEARPREAKNAVQKASVPAWCKEASPFRYKTAWT